MLVLKMQSPNEEIGNTILSQVVEDCLFLFGTSLALPPHTLKFDLKEEQRFLPFGLGFGLDAVLSRWVCVSLDCHMMQVLTLVENSVHNAPL